MENADKQKQKSDEELAVYEKLRRRVSKLLGEVQEKISAEAVTAAMDKAVAELKSAGESSKEAITRAAAALKKDIASTTEHVKPKVEGVTGEARSRFEDLQDKGGELWRDISREAGYYMELSRDKGGAFLANVARGLSDWSSKLGQKLDTSLVYKSGEITHGGEFVCRKCAGRIRLKHPGHIPPCPKCANSEFRRL